MAKIIDITNQRFGRLVVIRRDNNDSHGKPQWLCKCDCGNQKIIIGAELKRGRTTSCGCFKLERITKHGLCYCDEYYIWSGMKQRCCNKSDKRYNRYGSRGIEVCDRWINSFENFYNDMGPRPSKRYSIERINNNDGYKPNNCKWAIMKDQHRNTSRNKNLTFNGKTLTLIEWSERLGIHKSTILSRLRRDWSVKRALTSKIK